MKRTPLRRKGRRKLSPEDQKAARLFRASVFGLPCVVCNELKPPFLMDPHQPKEVSR